MKSPLGKLRKLGLSKGEPEEDWDHHISVHIDGLTQAAKVHLIALFVFSAFDGISFLCVYMPSIGSTCSV